MTHLQRGSNVTSKDLMNLVGKNAFHDPEFRADLLTFSRLIETRTGAYFRLTEQGDWNPVIPFVKLPCILEATTDFSAKSPNVLMPLPELGPQSRGVSLPALHTIFVFGLAFHLLHRFAHANESVSPESISLVLSMLVRVAATLDDAFAPATASAADLRELVTMTPQSLAASAEYEGAPAATILELVGKCGDLGRVALDRMNVTRQESAGPGADREAARKRAAALRQAVMSSFRDRQSAFRAGVDEHEEEVEECTLCHVRKPDDCLAVPPTEPPRSAADRRREATRRDDTDGSRSRAA